MLHKHLLDFTRKYNKEFAIKGYSKLKKADLQQKIELVLNKQRKEIKEEYKQLKMMSGTGAKPRTRIKATKSPLTAEPAKKTPVKKPAPKKAEPKPAPKKAEPKKETKPKPAPKKAEPKKEEPKKETKKDDIDVKLLTPTGKKRYEEAIKDINEYSKELKIIENKMKKGNLSKDTKETYESRIKVANKRINIAEKDITKLKNSIKAKNKREEKINEFEKEGYKKVMKDHEELLKKVEKTNNLDYLQLYSVEINKNIKKFKDGYRKNDNINKKFDELNKKLVSLTQKKLDERQKEIKTNLKLGKTEVKPTGRSIKITGDEIIKRVKEIKKEDEKKKETKPKPAPKKEPVKKPIQKLKDLIENYKNEVRTKFNLQETTMAKLGNEKINKKYQEFSILNEELRNKLTEKIKNNEFKDIPAKTLTKNVKDFIKFLDRYNDNLFEELTKPAPNIEQPKIKQSGKLYTFQEYLDKKNNDFNDKMKEQEKQQPKEIVKASKLNIKNYDDFYKKLFETLSNRSKRNINSFIKSYPDFKDNINIILDSQTFLDFYPTPMHCLEPTKDIVKTADKILEPTAGLGAITYWLDKYIAGEKIMAVELEPTMAKILNQLQPKLNVLVGNFLNKPLNSFSGVDTIYCNPPFSLGNDKRFYYDFLFKCLAILNTNGRGRLIFISPSLIEDPIKDNYIDEYSIIKYKNLSPSKFDLIMKNYTPNPVSKAGFIKYLDTGEGQNAELFKLFKWDAGKVIMKCSGFGGTKIEAVVHQFVIL